LNMNLLSAAWACEANKMLLPSAADFAIAAAATLPPAPERFSTMNWEPNAWFSACAVSRASRSAVPPAGDGTMMVTGRPGRVCGAAAHGHIARAAASHAPANRRVITVDPTARRSNFALLRRHWRPWFAPLHGRTVPGPPDSFADVVGISALDPRH